MSQLASEVEQAPAAPPPGEGEEVIKGKTPWQLFWGRFKQDTAAFVGLGAIAIMVVLAVGAPVIQNFTHDPNDVSHFRDMSDDFGLPKGPTNSIWGWFLFTAVVTLLLVLVLRFLIKPGRLVSGVLFALPLAVPVIVVLLFQDTMRPNADFNFYFGADGIGRDVLSRTIYGVRLSLTVALLATLLSVAIGVALGIIAGYLGGWLDTVISRGVDIVLSIPVLLFALGIAAACSSTKEGCTMGIGYGLVPGPLALITTVVLLIVGLAVTRSPAGLYPAIAFLLLRALAPLVFPITQGPGLVVFVIVLFSWPTIARIVRGNTLSLREKEFVEASRSLGATNTQIMFREILPNLIAPVLVYATLLIPSNIIFEAALSFLGVGLPQSTPSLGRILSEASDLFDAGAWWLMVFPGVFLVAMTLAFNLLGDGLRDALDPRTARL